MVNLMLKAALVHYLRVNPWHTFFSIAGVAIAVCIVVVIDSTSKSAKESLNREQLFLQKRPAFTISSNSRGLDESVYRQLVLQGVDDAVATITGEARIGDEEYVVAGIDFLAAWGDRSVVDVAGGAGNWAEQINILGALVHPQSPLWDDVSIAVQPTDREEIFQLRILGRYSNTYGDPLTIVTNIPTAQHMLGRRGEIDQIHLWEERSDADVRQIKSLIGNHVITRSDDDIDFAQHMLSSYHINLSAMGVLAVLVSCLLLYNTLSIACLQRQRNFSFYRSVGVGRTVRAGVVLTEVMVLVFLGSLLGVIFGLVIANAILTLLNDFGTDGYAFHTELGLQIPLVTWVKIAAIAAVAVATAAFVPRVFSRRDSEGQGGVVSYNKFSEDKKILILAAGAVIAGVGYAVTHYSSDLVSAYTGLFIQVAGILCCIPLIVSLYLFSLGRVYSHSANIKTELAINGLKSNQSVCTMIVVCLVLVLSIGQSLDYVVTSLSRSVHHWVDTYFEADAYVSYDEQNGEEPRYFSDTDRARIESHLKVESTSAGIRIPQHSEYGKIDILALDLPTGLDGFIFTSPRPGFQQFQNSRTCLVAEALAIQANLSIGDQIELNTPSGNQPFEVIGIFKDYRPSNGLVSISINQYRQLWRDDRLFSIGLNSSTDLSRQDVSDIISSAGLQGVTTTIADELKSLVTRSLEKSLYVMEAVKIGIVITGMLGVIGCISILILEKKNEYIMYWRFGFSKTEIVSIILTGALLIGLSAGVLSIPFALLIAHNIIDVINIHAFGWLVETSFDVSTSMLALAMAILATMVGSVIALNRTIKALSRQSENSYFHEQTL